MIYHVGPYCVTLMPDDTVAATAFDEPLTEDESNWRLPPTKVKGLLKHMTTGKGGTIVLVTVEDMEIIHFIKRGHKYGFSYALNLDVPYFSEWGDSGIVR